MSRPIESKIAALRAALPSKGITLIANSTNLPYQLVYRCLIGEIKVWDARHDLVIQTAETIIKSAGAALRKG